MTRHVALLRAVNVGGRGKIAMVDLKTTATSLDFTDVATVLQSGSLVFTASGVPAALEKALERALSDRLGLATDVMVRSAEQWRKLIAVNPFPAAATTDPSHLLLLACKGKPRPGADAALREPIAGPERVGVAGGDAYAVFPDGIGRSKLTGAVLERHLGTPTTGRNWNTVLKIAAGLGL